MFILAVNYGTVEYQDLVVNYNTYNLKLLSDHVVHTRRQIIQDCTVCSHFTVCAIFFFWVEIYKVTHCAAPLSIRTL